MAPARPRHSGQHDAGRHWLPRVPSMALALALLTGSVAPAPATAGVQIVDSVAHAPGYSLDLGELGTRADGVGGVLAAPDGLAEPLLPRLVLVDGELGCEVETTRRCAQVAKSTSWVLLACFRQQSCTHGDATVRAAATSLLSLRSKQVNVTTTVLWSLVSGTAPVLPEQPFAVASTVAPVDNAVAWLEPGSAALTQSPLNAWPSATCALPFTAQLAYPEPWAGILTLVAQATSTSTGAGASPVACGSATQPDGTIRLDLARLTPALDEPHRFTLVARVTPPDHARAEDATMLAAALRGAVTSSPTAAVPGAQRWQLDDRDATAPDDFREDLGLAGLTLDGVDTTAGIAWEVGPVDDAVLGNVARDDPAWLLRGQLAGGTAPPQVYKVREGVIEPDAALVIERVEAAAIRVFAPSKQWEPFTPGAAMCARGSPRHCLEVASYFPFTGIDIELARGPQDMGLSWQYWSGPLGDWAPLSVASDSTAARFQGSGHVRWSLPAGWARTDVDVGGVSVPLYQIRVDAEQNYSGEAPAAASIVPDLRFVELQERVSERTELLLTDDRAPIAAVTQANVEAELYKPVQLDGSASEDPDGDALTFTWEQTSGEPVRIAVGATPPVVELTPVQAGLYGFRLTVSDGQLVDSTYAFVRAGTAVILPAGRSRRRGCASSAATAGSAAALGGLLALLRARRSRAR